jgi:hypothetical protein
MRPAVAVTAVLLALGTGGCSGSTKHYVAAPPTTVAPAIRLKIAGTDLVWAGKAAAFPPTAQAGVLETLNKWLAGGVVAPLQAGVAGDIAGLFSAEVAPRLTGPDRVALVDEGLPRATAITPLADTVKLTVLTGQDGAVVLVTAKLNLRLAVEALDGPYAVSHSGELVLEPAAGGWRISGYDVRSTHEDTAGVTTTTAASTATTARAR